MFAFRHSFVLMLAWTVSGPAVAEPGPVVRTRYLMGTLLEVRAFGDPRLLDQALDRVAEIEQQLTQWRSDGGLTLLNARCAGQAATAATVDPDLGRAIAGALEWARRTDGAFDPTIGALADAWGLRDGGRTPTSAELASARERSGWRRAHAAGRQVECEGGLQFDLGGYGKGYALDEAAAVLRAAGVPAALLNFGGQVLALGAPPGEPGWLVDLASPRDRGTPALTLRLRDASAATSTNAPDTAAGGHRAHAHVIDARTGRPALTAGSVTVIAPDAAAADALSTALLVAGSARAAELAPAGTEYVFLAPSRAGGIEKEASPGFERYLEANEDQGGAAPADARIDELERRLEVMAEELQELRMQREATAEPPAAASVTPGARGLAPSASKVYRAGERRLSIGGYGEMLAQGVAARRDDDVGANESASVDFLRAVLYFGYKFTDRILFNSEIEFEHATAGDGQDGEVSVEFAYIDFLLDPRINVRAGLLLVPVGLINELHEPTVFLGARRPDVERVILPTTWRENGAGIHGDLGPFSYRAYVMAGLDSSGFTASNGIRGGRQSGSESRAEDLALAARLDLTGVPGLLAGVSVYGGGSGQGATAGGEAIEGRVRLFDAHADWRWRGWSARGLWARVSIDDAALIAEQTGQAIGSRLSGWYLETGYDVLAPRARRSSLVPFVRFESFDTQREVPAALRDEDDPANARSSWTLGVLFKPIPEVAIKLDYHDLDNDAGTGADRFHAALGYSF